MLEIKNLTKKYFNENKHTIAIEDVNFKVEKSKFISIIGPSGCGKSTLLRIIAGLEIQTSGKIDYSDSNSSIGFVSQSYSLFPWLTVFENIAFGLRLKELDDTKINQIVNKYLLITGLDKFRNSYPKNLSGGMQQRVAIVRTLANNPDIILMDEPFGALDVQTRSQMQEFLVKILKEENKTVIMVTHDIEEAVYLSDEVVVLSTKPGSVKEIIKVNFPKPRKPDLKNQNDFIEVKKSISYALKSETIRSTTDEKNLVKNATVFKLGSNIWTGLSPAYLAKELGIFDQNNINVEIVTLEWSKDRLEPLRSGLIDALDTPLDSAIKEVKNNPDLEIFMPLDFSNGGDAIITNKEIKNISDLKGKIIGIEKDWVSHFFLNYVLEKNNLSINDVSLVDIKASDIGKDLILGKIQGASVQEPWLTKIKEYTDVNVLKTTSDFSPLIYAVLLVRKDVLNNKLADFENFKKSWTDSVAKLQSNFAENISLIAPYLGISEIELSEQLQTIQFNNLDTSFKQAISETEKFINY